MLYTISDDDTRRAAAGYYSLTSRTGPDILGKFMHFITIIRNICAHDGRLYNRLFEQKPNLSKQEKAILRRNPDGTPDNEHLFSYIIVMKRLLDKSDFTDMKNRLAELNNEYPFVSMRYYGFCDNWQTIL